jgi:ABC-2 type transport system ATP-binding protein
VQEKTDRIIEVSHFSKKYGDFTAVDDISFGVERGTIFAFLGPNGAGKSTTISTLCTIQEKTSGELFIDGHEVSRQQDLVRSGIGIVFQDSTLDAKLTVTENLQLHCEFYKVPRGEVARRIAFGLDLVDLSDWADAPVESLSGGMRRRAEIARSLVHFPKVLFLDEPTTGLDPQTRLSVWEYLQRLQKEKGITIFLTTHYMDEAEICDQVAVIDHGKIVAHDTPYELKKRHTSTVVDLAMTDPEDLLRHLGERGLGHEVVGSQIRVRVSGSAEALEIVTRFRSSIEDVEIRKGTLDDVFIALTGKEIRK